jgi:hypothetical protein
MIKNYWKRFNIYQQCLAVFFIVALFLDVINKKLLGSTIPTEIVSYLFWLSLGLYLGFRLCKYEYSNAIKKHEEQQK